MTTAVGARPAVHPPTVGAARRPEVVEDAGAGASAGAAVEHAIIVVEVENVGEQALGRSLSQLNLSYPTVTPLLPRRRPAAVVAVDVAAGTLHAQQPSQILAHTFSHLQSYVHLYTPILTSGQIIWRRAASSIAAANMPISGSNPNLF